MFKNSRKFFKWYRMLSFVETDVISEIVLTKNNSEILKLKNQYKTQFGQDLDPKKLTELKILFPVRKKRHFKRILTRF